MVALIIDERFHGYSNRREKGMNDHIVRHETEDYEYLPSGLMAEDWGKTGHRTDPPEFVVSSNLQQRKWMDNDSTRDSVMYIWSLDDATVMDGRLNGSDAHREIVCRLGGSIYDTSPPDYSGRRVNPYWVTMQCANAAYDRGLIYERELDRIVDE